MPDRSILVCFSFFFCTAMLVSGCKKNCGSLSCHDFGYIAALNLNVTEVCYNGYCACPSGLEGDSCQTFSYTKYLQPSSTWSVSDACSASSTYTVFMTSDPSYYYKLYINRLFNTASAVEADIVPSASKQGVNLNIPQQTVGQVTVSGSGLYQANGTVGKITLNLVYVESGISSNCTIVMNQQ